MKNKKLIQIFTIIDKNFYDIVLAFLIFLNIAPILAPIFAALGLNFLAVPIYFIYSFFCHQLDWRSIHAFDYQYAWCARDTFIWLNILLAGLVTRKWKIPVIKWYWLIFFVVPIALDGGVQTIATLLGFVDSEPLYISTNFMRMLTGTIFGLGFGFWIMPNMKEVSAGEDNRPAFPFKKRFFLPVVVVLNLILYLILVGIWNLTSPVNKAANFLDLAVKTPANPADWLVRRKHGL
jgi:uncharacterized membrane protein